MTCAHRCTDVLSAGLSDTYMPNHPASSDPCRVINLTRVLQRKTVLPHATGIPWVLQAGSPTSSADPVPLRLRVPGTCSVVVGVMLTNLLLAGSSVSDDILNSALHSTGGKHLSTPDPVMLCLLALWVLQDIPALDEPRVIHRPACGVVFEGAVPAEARRGECLRGYDTACSQAAPSCTCPAPSPTGLCAPCWALSCQWWAPTAAGQCRDQQLHCYADICEYTGPHRAGGSKLPGQGVVLAVQWDGLLLVIFVGTQLSICVPAPHLELGVLQGGGNQLSAHHRVTILRT